MRKLFVLAFKEVVVTFRDTGALIAMLVTPIALTLAIAAAFGSGGDATLEDIPIAIINHDKGMLSESLIEVFDYEDVALLVDVRDYADEASARSAVESGDIVSLVIIPTDFSNTMFPQLQGLNSVMGTDVTRLEAESFDADALSEEQEQQIAQLFIDAEDAPQTEPLSIEIYTNPDWRISSSVVKSIVNQGLEIMTIQINGISASMRYSGFASAGEAAGTTDLQRDMDTDIDTSLDSLPVQLEVISPSGHAFSWLDYMATSMAILFVMFAVTSGSHTLLAERSQGTLQRLLITPNGSLTILIGKMAGVILMGLLQVLVLWGATSLVGAHWGPPGAVIISIVVLVLCASGVGAFISAWSPTAGRASAIGSAVTLVGSALSGSFFPREGLPMWVQTISKITPQAWGIEIFTTLSNGGDLSNILPLLGGALVLTLGYYVVAILGFRKQFA